MAAGLDAARASLSQAITGPPADGGFGDRVMSALEKAVGCDGYCLFGVDPISGLRSVMFSRDGLTVSTETLVHNETVQRDANRYQDLITRADHVGTLSDRTAAGSRSSRLNDMLRPEGYGSELRLAIVSDGRYWGALSMFRQGARYPFGDNDAERVARLVGPLSLALRRYQVGRPGGTHTPRPPGILLFRRRNQVVTISGEAHTWLRALASSGQRGPTAEDLLRVTYEVASASARPHAIPTTRARMPDGGWLVVSGTRISDDDADVAVVLACGDPRSIAPAFSAWCGLTAKQAEVLDLLVAGLATKQIARRLGLSPLTVNDHLKSVYRKAGVPGREELLSLLC